jgi:hypothetical protein
MYEPSQSGFSHLLFSQFFFSKNHFVLSTKNRSEQNEPKEQNYVIGY